MSDQNPSPRMCHYTYTKGWVEFLVALGEPWRSTKTTDKVVIVRLGTVGRAIEGREAEKATVGCR